MRVFASDTIKSMMGRLNLPEDQAIEHKIISRALETAQEKIEGFNFDSRKHILEFDDVINNQRRSVYNRRRKLLLGSIDDIENELFDMLGLDNMQLSEKTMASDDAGNNDVQDILAKKIKEFGRESFISAMRIVLLQTIDMYWVEHLEVMDYTRSSVNLRAYGQRDPLVEYKKEGLRLFKEMNAAIRGQIERLLPNVVPTVDGVPVDQSKNNDSAELQEIHENAVTIGKGSDSNSISTKKEETIGRNDPCPCGSGKKYKKCHGK